MKIKGNELLTKLIEIQSSIIQGQNIKAIMHKNQDFYLKYSGADIITICIKDLNRGCMEYIFEKEKKFENFIKKYLFNKNNLTCHSFVCNYEKYFTNNKAYYEITNFYDIFNETLSKDKGTYFTNDIQMKEAVIMPIFDFRFEKKIAYVTFIFTENNNKNLEKIEEMKNFFEVLIQALYDYRNDLIFSKCTRVDQNFKLLTAQEKRIIKKVLRGKTYIEIAGNMDISINTIKTHIKNIFNKYNVSSKIELYNKIIDHIL
jgi:DNA-binding CsgD family transcriptional regulator